MEQILILGSGGHAASLTDIIECENKYKIAGYVVNEQSGSIGIDYPVIGTDRDLPDLYQSGIRYAAIGIGYLGKSDLRERLYQDLKEIGFYMPVICDPSATVSQHVTIEEGTVIGKGAVINAGVSIGKMCIVNTGAIVEHDCRIADFSHISVGSVLCGSVTVKKAAFIGANATVIQGKVIGSNCIVGAGTVIRKNVEDNAVIVMNIPEIYRGGGIIYSDLYEYLLMYISRRWAKCA